ncbi:MAG TPA: hypothetical protein VMT20_12245 [Terriglobia bacterium]|nr:hypothetical protein [Terriglobia bacterium]
MHPSIRTSWFASLACVLCLSAVTSGQNAKPALGQIVRSSLASLGGVQMPSGGTVVSGDTLTTAKSGGALVKFSATSQLEVSEDTSVSLDGTPSHLVAKLGKGTVTASVQGSSYLAVSTSGCRIEPSVPAGASYSVALAPGASANASATVTANQGSVSLMETATGTRRSLPEGQSAACPAVVTAARPEEGAPAPSQSAGQAPPATPEAHGGSNTTLLLLLAGGGAAAGIAAAAAGGHGGGGGGPASPSSP